MGIIKQIVILVCISYKNSGQCYTQHCHVTTFILWLMDTNLVSGVRLDRVRGGRQKYKRAVDSLPLAIAISKKICSEGGE